MPEGQFLKIKGIVCNIPIETEEVCNVLPRTLDNSNVIFMKLKRKLCYSSHVIAESVRLEMVFSILNLLKNVNPLYSHINVQDLVLENVFDTRFVNEQDVDFTINNAESTDSSITIVIRFVDDKDVPQTLNK